MNTRLAGGARSSDADGPGDLPWDLSALLEDGGRDPDTDRGRPWATDYDEVE
ncbi:MAG: hypothetical protein AB7O78_03810 [Thermoleophilia bacterium]